MINNDTIVAQVTFPAKSAVGILRISGNQAKKVAIKILGKVPLARFATYSNFIGSNNIILDKGLALWFPSPFSMTGEDVLELQGHGSPIVLDLLIKRILSIKNIRIAKPGEFSERAFLNGKMDLIQAESIDDLINAETELSARASLNSLQGHFSNFIQKLIDMLIELRVTIEASIDFSEEEIDFDVRKSILSAFKNLNKKFLEIKNILIEGYLLKEGKKIVILGLPNSGKSSLLNILSGRDRAIVTNIPGTTRDLIYDNINIHGIACELIDTAGLRETDNEIEKIGIIRALEIMKKSDHILFVVDKTDNKVKQKKIIYDFIKNFPNNIPITFVLNKNDLVKDKKTTKKIKNFLCINVSAKTGQGINILRKHIVKIEKNHDQEGFFIARRRHVYQLDLAYKSFLKAKKNWILEENCECLADSLRIINNFLGEITGKCTSEDLLDRIFSSFCIGK